LSSDQVSSGVAALDKVLGGGGYPSRSTILIVGPPGIGKEALGYWFIQSGLDSGAVCLHATRLSAREVNQDQKAYQSRKQETAGLPYLLAREGGQARFDVRDPEGFLANMRELIKNNAGRPIRIFIDFLSSLLILNPVEASYKFVDELISESKKQDVVLVATLEEGMHSQQVLAAMQQIFDGFIELSFYRVGLSVYPLLKVGKMRGMKPQGSYYSISFGEGGIDLEHAGVALAAPNSAEDISKDESFATFEVTDPEARTVFNFLVKCFIEDYLVRRAPVEQSGWRSRIKIVQSTKVTQVSLYGWQGHEGPVFRELLSKGIVETRIFPRERGRGGEVVKVRIAYDKEPIKRAVDRVIFDRSAKQALPRDQA
jgi:KaiC/GvpD/RAD55 family RecA-like ATPase